MPATTFSDGSTPTICIIGAGFGGLTTAIQLKRKLRLETFTIFEKNCDVGGAWLVNTYPGAACDIPSAMYSWSFEVNLEWSHAYAKQHEILEYMRSTARKYDLYSHLKTKTQVTSAIWNKKLQNWKVTYTDLETQQAISADFDFVIISVGHLWNPNIPKMFEAFQGPMMHTAQWDDTVDLKGQRVGVIGSGLSAIQVVPAIVKDVGELHYVQRTPVWVAPKVGNFKYSSCTRGFIRRVPVFSKMERKFGLGLFDTSLSYGLSQASGVRAAILKSIRSAYVRVATRGNQEVMRLTKPPKNSPMLCRNFGTSNKYMQSLCSKKVHIYRDEVKTVTEDSIIVGDGTKVQLDVLILATGFKSQEYFGPITVLGQDGIDVQKAWMTDQPRNYYGVCTTSAKNLFFTLAPQSIFLHNSALLAIECQVNFIAKVLKHMMETGSKECHLKPEVESNFSAKRDRALSKTVWGDEACKSTHPDNKGLLPLVFHARGYDLWRALRKLDPTLFEFN